MMDLGKVGNFVFLSVFGFVFGVLAMPIVAGATELEDYLYCIDVNDGRMKDENIEVDKLLSLAEKARENLPGNHGIAI